MGAHGVLWGARHGRPVHILVISLAAPGEHPIPNPVAGGVALIDLEGDRPWSAGMKGKYPQLCNVLARQGFERSTFNYHGVGGPGERHTAGGCCGHWRRGDEDQQSGQPRRNRPRADSGLHAGSVN